MRNQTRYSPEKDPTTNSTNRNKNNKNKHDINKIINIKGSE